MLFGPHGLLTIGHDPGGGDEAPEIICKICLPYPLRSREAVPDLITGLALLDGRAH